MDAAWDALYARADPWRGPAPAPSFLASLAPGARVLDLGCGAGKSLRALRGVRAVGVDASLPGLRRARPLSVVAGDAARLPLRDASVDAVLVHHLLAHLPPDARGAAAGEAERVLRPGGALEVREFAEGDLRDGAGAAAGPRDRVRGGIATHYFAAGELAALFPRCAGAESDEARAVRFAAQPRRWRVLRARRAPPA